MNESNLLKSFKKSSHNSNHSIWIGHPGLPEYGEGFLNAGKILGKILLEEINTTCCKNLLIFPCLFNMLHGTELTLKCLSLWSDFYSSGGDHTTFKETNNKLGHHNLKKIWEDTLHSLYKAFKDEALIKKFKHYNKLVNAFSIMCH